MATEASALEEQIKRLEAVATRLENVALRGGKKKSGGGDDEVEKSEATEAYLELVNGDLAAFLKACDAVPGYPMEEGLAGPLLPALKAVADYVVKGDSCKKPKTEELQQALAPLSVSNQAYEKLKYAKKPKKMRDFFNHVQAMQNCVDGLAWTYSTLPKQAASSGFEGAEMYLNKILKEHPASEEKSKPHRDFVTACKNYLKAQVGVVKEHFKMGITWTGQKSINDVAGAPTKAAAAPTATEEKAPEPEKPKKKKVAAKPKGNLADELAKGLAITSKLKHVTKGQRNKGKKIPGKVDGGVKKAKAKKKLPDPKKTKRGQTWFLEYYQEGLITLDAEFLPRLNPSMGIFIAGSLNCQFLIPEDVKVKSIVVDGCKRVQVQTSDIVSTVEMVNCKNCTLWLNGTTPSVTVDKSDSPKIVIMEKCWNQEKMVDILTSNVTAGNIELPADGDEDTKTIPIVEQYYCRIDKETKGTKFEPYEHAG